MNFGFTEEQQDIFAAVQDLCDDVFAPKASEVDAAGEWPQENVDLLAQSDLMGISVPEEYGGLGLGCLEWAVIGEKLSAACTTTGAIYGAHMLCVYPIMLFGTEEQKEEYLHLLATGQVPMRVMCKLVQKSKVMSTSSTAARSLSAMPARRIRTSLLPMSSRRPAPVA